LLIRNSSKFGNPTIITSGRKVTGGERRRREKNAVNSGLLVPCSARLAAGTKSIRAKNRSERVVSVSVSRLETWPLKAASQSQCLRPMTKSISLKN
jgi:hypothetical protein